MTCVETALDNLHHVAISVPKIAEAVDWYCATFRCEVTYQDDTWAMLRFANVNLALVIPSQHPPHLGFSLKAAPRRHRVGVCERPRRQPRRAVVARIVRAMNGPGSRCGPAVQWLPIPGPSATLSLTRIAPLLGE